MICYIMLFTMYFSNAKSINEDERIYSLHANRYLMTGTELKPK